MSYSLYFNKQKINFFIQGQDLEISFIFRNAFFVLVFYKEEKNISIFKFHKYIFLKKPVDSLKTVTNIYNPTVYFLSIGIEPMLIKRELNIKYLDVVEDKFSLKDQALEIVHQKIKVNRTNYNLLNSFDLIRHPFKIKLKNYKPKSHQL